MDTTLRYVRGFVASFQFRWALNWPFWVTLCSPVCMGACLAVPQVLHWPFLATWALCMLWLFLAIKAGISVGHRQSYDQMVLASAAREQKAYADGKKHGGERARAEHQTDIDRVLRAGLTIGAQMPALSREAFMGLKLPVPDLVAVEDCSVEISPKGDVS